jgi:hypothetical protein
MIKAGVVGLMALGMTTSPIEDAAATDEPGKIQWRYSIYNFIPFDWYRFERISIDGELLNAYAKSRYGITATAYMERNHAHGWRIKYQNKNRWIVTRIDMLDATQYAGKARWGKRVLNWGCGFANWSGTSWHGIIILKK